MARCIKCERSFNSIKEIFDIDDVLCDRCRLKFKPSLKMKEVDGFKVYYLYEYNEDIMSVLVELKGHGNMAAAKALIPNKIRRKLRRMFKNKIFVYMPSTDEDDEERGFKHLEVLYNHISNKYYSPFRKDFKRKQALCTYQERKEVFKYIHLKEEYKFLCGDDEIVLVDDVMTSGSTLLAGRNLLSLSENSVLVLTYNHGDL